MARNIDHYELIRFVQTLQNVNLDFYGLMGNAERDRCKRWMDQVLPPKPAKETSEGSVLFSVGIMTSNYDTWIIEDELPSLSVEDLKWFKDKCGLSREDLYRVLARAKEIAQEYKLKPSEIRNLTYDTDGAWYIHFDDDRETIYREDQTITRQQADMAKAE